MIEYEDIDFEAIAAEARKVRLELEALYDNRGQRIAD